MPADVGFRHLVLNPQSISGDSAHGVSLLTNAWRSFQTVHGTYMSHPVLWLSISEMYSCVSPDMQVLRHTQKLLGHASAVQQHVG